MEIEKAIGICKNLLKIEYDGCFGTNVYHPHSMSIEDVEAIETVLNALDNSISKDKIRAKIKIYETTATEYPSIKGVANICIKELEELLEEE